MGGQYRHPRHRYPPRPYYDHHNVDGSSCLQGKIENRSTIVSHRSERIEIILGGILEVWYQMSKKHLHFMAIFSPYIHILPNLTQNSQIKTPDKNH